MLKAIERHNLVVVANAVELTTQSIIKLMGGQKSINNLGSSRQEIADGVAARINAAVTLEARGQ